MLVTSDDVATAATKACRAIPHCERLIQSLLQAPLSPTQQHRLIALWLAPMANEYHQAQRNKKYEHVAVLLTHTCHIAIATCHILGSIVTANAGVFAVVGVVLTGIVASIPSLRDRIPDASVHALAAKRIEAVGMRFVAGLSQKQVSDVDFKACVNDLVAAAHPELPAESEIGTVKKPSSIQQAVLQA